MVTLVLSTEEQCEAYTSDEMLPLLRSLSPSFERFLGKEGRTLLRGKPIYWISTDTAPESLVLHDTENAHVVEDTSSIIVVLQHLPSGNEDAYVAAHELGHVVLQREGFPFPRKVIGNVPLAFALYAMLQDPLINTRLSLYGFDAVAHYTANVDRSLAALSEAEAPDEPLDRLLWYCNIVGILLDGEYSRADEVRRRFQIEMFLRYPELVPGIRELYSLVRETGFDTPRQQRRVLRGIAKRYHLREIPNLS